ncbi:MAG: NADH:ubiquinone reductase (Na(+)-transporting) subunit C [Bacteroidota bacterium]
MRQSNTYVILFAVVLTIVLGGLLSLAAVGLKPIQKIQVELDTKKQILGAVMSLDGSEDVLKLYDERTESFVVDHMGNIISEDEDGNKLIAENINIGKEYKKPVEDRKLPVFKFLSSEDPSKAESYIFPMYGNGLWNNIWAFVALDTDFNTIKGVAFDHVGETPGLGARITSPVIQGRYKGKEIYDESGSLVSITMVKGENGNNEELGKHKVDGMSGATLTAKGVNAMLESYLNYYQPYIKKLKNNSNLSLNTL